MGFPPFRSTGLHCWWWFFFVLFSSTVLTSSAEGDDDDDPYDGHEINLHVKGRSGLVTIMNEYEGLSDPNRVTISISHIHEIGEDGTTILAGTQHPRHSFRSLANQAFGVTKENELDSTYSIPARKITVTTTITSQPNNNNKGSDKSGDGSSSEPFQVGTVDVELFVFEGNGTITTGFGESWDVFKGDVKFNLLVKDWKFCQPTIYPCFAQGQGQGQSQGEELSASWLEVGLRIQSKNQRRIGNDGNDDNDPVPVEGSNNLQYVLDEASGLDLQLARGVFLNNVLWDDQPPGYPQYGNNPNYANANPNTDGANKNNKNSKKLFLARFPRFATSARYDPIVNSHVVLPQNRNPNDDQDDDNGDRDNRNNTNNGLRNPNNRTRGGSGGRRRPHNTGVHILGKSGAFTIHDTTVGWAKDPNRVLVKVDALYERDGDGVTAIPAHSWHTFATQDFEILGENETDDSLGVPAQLTVFSSTLEMVRGGGGSGDDKEDVGTLVLYTYIFRGNGTARAIGSGEEWPVVVGDVKFSIALKNWTFCNPCVRGNGQEDFSEYVDVLVQIQGRRDQPEPSRSNRRVFSLGGDVSVILSDMVQADGVWHNMSDLLGTDETTATADTKGAPENSDDRCPALRPDTAGTCLQECNPSDHSPCRDNGRLCCSNGCGHVCKDPAQAVDKRSVATATTYPKATPVGGRTLFTFRFPKFSDAATYDPTIDYHLSYLYDGSTETTTSGTNRRLLSSTIWLLGVLALPWWLFG